MNSARGFVTKLLINKVSNVNYEVRRYGNRWKLPTMIRLTALKQTAEEPPTPVRSSFLEWNRNSEIYAFNARLSENFDTQKLEQAFTHKSYIIQEEKKQKELGIEEPNIDIEDNQAFISNGQKLVSEITYKHLSESFPRAPFEAIQAFHDYLLSDTTLAKISSNLGTKDLILAEEYPPTDQTLADTFYALVAALAESVDINHASKFVRDFLIATLAEKDLNEIWSPSDPVEILNEILAKQNREPVEPRIITRSGVETLMAVYQIAMYSNKEYLAAGFGQSISEAKEAAAMNALFRICNISDSSNTMKFSQKIK